MVSSETLLFAMSFGFLLCTVHSNALPQDPEGETGELPKLWKCCPEDQFFNLATGSCSSSADVDLSEYAIDPAIYDYGDAETSDDDFQNSQDEQTEEPKPKFRSNIDEEEEYDEEQATPEEQISKAKFTFQGVKYPLCDVNQELTYMYVPSNDPRAAQFTILPKNGSLFLTLNDDSLVYADYCVDRGFKNNALANSTKAALAGFGQLATSNAYAFLGSVVAFCQPVEAADCRRRPCIQNCCSSLEVYNAETGRCDDPRSNATEEITWKPELHNDETADIMSQDQLINYWNIQDPKLGTNFPIRIFYSRSLSCKSQTYNVTKYESDFRIFQNGDIKAGGGVFNYSSYCVRRVESIGKDSNPTFWDQAQVCIPDNPESQGYLKWVTQVDLKLIPVLLVVSVVFLGLLFIHLWIRNRAKLFGAMMLSTIATLASFYIFLTAVKFAGSQLVRSSPTTCTVLGFLIQFTNLSSFFWLNSMAFDIWMKFRSLTSQNARRVSVMQRETALGCAMPRFKWYALYAWGIPLIVVSVTILMQFLPSPASSDIVLPYVGRGNCFLGQKMSTLLYLHVITAPVLCANILFFISFVYNLCWGVWGTKASDPIAQQRQRSNLKTVVKMFFVMGLTWIAEIISFVLSWMIGPTKIYKFVVFFDFVNAMQGFTMFCVLFFDRETIRKFRNKIQNKNNRITSNHSSNGDSTPRVPRFSLISLSPLKVRRGRNTVAPKQETCDVKL